MNISDGVVAEAKEGEAMSPETRAKCDEINRMMEEYRKWNDRLFHLVVGIVDTCKANTGASRRGVKAELLSKPPTWVPFRVGTRRFYGMIWTIQEWGRFKEAYPSVSDEQLMRMVGETDPEDGGTYFRFGPVNGNTLADFFKENGMELPSKPPAPSPESPGPSVLPRS